MNDRPYFSVVMPTYNRAHLIGQAITSILQQSFDDFEIVISDSGSTDNTEDVIESFKDPRIRYIGGREKLRIGDNYERALTHANGQYVTFLSDDDAFVPVMFETTKKVLDKDKSEIVAFRLCPYNHENGSIGDSVVPANSLELLNYTMRETQFTGHEALKQVFRINDLIKGRIHPQFIVPYLANAIYNRSVFDKLRATKLHLFQSTPADMYLAAAVFYVADSYTCIDAPLHLWSRWAGSSTAVPSHHGTRLRAHYERLLNGEELEATPLKFPLLANCISNSLLRARKDLESPARKIAIDWSLYYTSAFKYLTDFQRLGIDVDEELSEYERVLAAADDRVRERVNDNINSWLGTNSVSRSRRLRNELIQVLRTYAPRLENLLKGVTAQIPAEIVKGVDAGFSDILSAAEYIRKRFY